MSTIVSAGIDGMCVVDTPADRILFDYPDAHVGSFGRLGCFLDARVNGRMRLERSGLRGT